MSRVIFGSLLVLAASLVSPLQAHTFDPCIDVLRRLVTDFDEAVRESIAVRGRQAKREGEAYRIFVLGLGPAFESGTLRQLREEEGVDVQSYLRWSPPDASATTADQRRVEFIARIRNEFDRAERIVFLLEGFSFSKMKESLHRTGPTLRLYGVDAEPTNTTEWELREVCNHPEWRKKLVFLDRNGKFLTPHDVFRIEADNLNRYVSDRLTKKLNRIWLSKLLTGIPEPY